MNYISSNIKFLRLQKGLTQDDIAKVVEKSRVLISQWESDAREITTEDIIKLSDFFNIPMDLLVGKDLRTKEKNSNFDELELLFDKHKNILTDSDKNIIKTIIEERKKEIDKELGEEK